MHKTRPTFTIAGRDSGAPSHAAHCGCCFIIPTKVLKRFARDKKLKAGERKAFANAAKFEVEWRSVREAKAQLSLTAKTLLPSAQPATTTPPADNVYDCKTGTVLPGVAVPNPQSSSDASAKQAYTQAGNVAEFYQDVFGRNSIDGAGMALISSIHYSVKYNNAFWNGSQMVYGDGDGNIFVDFTRGNDVIGHELTHGVTQHTAGLNYADEPGGLNESISDVFGSMFRQWSAKNPQDVTQADWLIGSDIMGPGATARGYTCLRDMANPAAAHCLAPQPTNFSQYKPGMDPHESSGIPNLAFYKAAMAVGGKSWETVGQIWYKALTGFPADPNMSMKMFANRTRSLAKSAAVKAAVDSAWKAVGL
jgi:Zn-dependent metalloprotease